MNTPALHRLSFALYGSRRGKPMRHVTWKQLVRIPFLLARAEESGCEGCYVEIAKWNPHAGRYERFAFQKFFGGELWDGVNDRTVAARIALMVNLVSKTDMVFARTSRRGIYKCQISGRKYTTDKGPSVVATMPYEFASLVHSMPCWNPTKKSP